MPRPEPLYGFKYSPCPSISTLAMFELFSKTTHFPSPCLSLFAPKPTRHLTVPQSTMLGEQSLPKMAGPLRLNQLITKGTCPLFSYCEQPDVYSFYCDAFSILISFCHSVHLWIGQSKNITSTQIFVAESNAHGTLRINGVFQFLLLIFRNVYMHIGITHLYYVIIFLSSDVWLSGFLHEDSIALHFGLWQLFPCYWFYLKSLKDTQGFSGSQRFYIQAKRLERNCKLCFAFSHSHKTHQSRPHSRELNLLIRCWQHFAIRECPLRKPDIEIQERLKLNFALWNQPESHLEFPRHFSKCLCLLLFL